MTTSIFIDGAAGTTGLEIRERLCGRPEFALITLPEASRRDAAARREALNDADVVILCLPDEAAREAVALIERPAVKVIDASTAHRTHVEWSYGFPELEPDGRDRIAHAVRVTNPGCYPTGYLALVRPLVRAGLIAPDRPLTVNAISGFSGGGKAMIAEYETLPHPPALRAYALALGHKHVAEMRAHSGQTVPPVFTPAVANTYRGMLVEVPLPLAALPGRPTLGAIRAALARDYSDTPLVRHVADERQTLAIEHAAGSDRLDLFVFGDEVDGQARLIAALDNLGKGAAGAAVQNLNLMCGLDETAGLRL